MRWLFNSLLALAGVPLLGATFVLICSSDPALKDDFNGRAGLGLFACWVPLFALFTCAYVARTRWLERSGIYSSWSNFEAYMRENHGHPPVSHEEKAEFLSWAGLPEEMPATFRKTMQALYRRIHAEIQSEEQKKSYIKCLAWYASPWPVREDCYVDG